MPIYEYRCAACDAVNEYLVRNRDAPSPETCKGCGSGPLDRVMSRTTFKLKGDGWYATDYSSSGTGSSNSSGDDGGSDTSGESTSSAGPPAASAGEASKTD